VKIYEKNVFHAYVDYNRRGDGISFDNTKQILSVRRLFMCRVVSYCVHTLQLHVAVLWKAYLRCDMFAWWMHVFN